MEGRLPVDPFVQVLGKKRTFLAKEPVALVTKRLVVERRPLRQHPDVLQKLKELRERRDRRADSVRPKIAPVSKALVRPGGPPATLVVRRQEVKPSIVAPLVVKAAVHVDVETVEVYKAHMEVERVSVVVVRMDVEHVTVALGEADVVRMTRTLRSLDFALDCRNKRNTTEELDALRSGVNEALRQCVNPTPWRALANWMCGCCELHTCLNALRASMRENLSRDQCRLVVHQLRMLSSRMVSMHCKEDSFSQLPGFVGPAKLLMLFVDKRFQDLCNMWKYYTHTCRAFVNTFDLDDMMEWVEDMWFVATHFVQAYAHDKQRQAYWVKELRGMDNHRTYFREKRQAAIEGSPHFSPPRVPVAQLRK